MSHPFISSDTLTLLLQSKGIFTFEDALHFVKQIPYGRNTNRDNFSLVITENKGTCSSKHAFLKEVANQNAIPNIKLIIGIYKMNETNTKIGTILSENQINYIPEAHCYLKVNNEVIDVTSYSSDFKLLKNDILEEIEIEPKQVGDFKIKYHQEFLKKWITKNEIRYSFDAIWKIREQCINYLATN
jgi:hypothetical protein